VRLQSACPHVSRSQIGMQERVWLNEGGERVVKKKKKKQAPDADDPVNEERRLLLFGALSSPALLIGATFFKNSVAPSSSKSVSGTTTSLLGDDGDAVTSPSLELDFVEQVTEVGPASAAPLIPLLEQREGSQLAAAGQKGRWVLPWVGGWDRIYCSNMDSTWLGGPKDSSFSARGDRFVQTSARNFVYGPGEGGITIEYLHETERGGNKLLLTRPGAVTNLGDNTFRVDFGAPLEEFEVGVDSRTGNDKLTTGEQLTGGVERASSSASLFLRTTYLSERLWIVRDLSLPDRVAVYQRTSTRSVMDRRGLVAEGQLKPPSDETIRYGRLLFGDTAEDYQGWKAGAEKSRAERDRLLSR